MAQNKYSCIQGDSFALDFYSPELSTLDADWVGQWAIVDKLGAGRATLASGTLGKNDNNSKFELRVKPSDTAGLAIAEYFLVVQITNTVIEFNQEIVQDVFIITEQGL